MAFLSAPLDYNLLWEIVAFVFYRVSRAWYEAWHRFHDYLVNGWRRFKSLLSPRLPKAGVHHSFQPWTLQPCPERELHCLLPPSPGSELEHRTQRVQAAGGVLVDQDPQDPLTDRANAQHGKSPRKPCQCPERGLKPQPLVCKRTHFLLSSKLSQCSLSCIHLDETQHGLNTRAVW